MQIYKEFTFRYIVDQQLKILVYIKKGLLQNHRISVTNSIKTSETESETAEVNPITYSICVVLHSLQ